MASDWWNNPKPGDVEKAERLLDEEFPPDYQPVLPARFTCEVHDVSGSCTLECAQLLAGMIGDAQFDPNYVYDPTGCSEPAPRPYDEVEYDSEHRAVLIVTFVPTIY
jgi:hypothetical protein